MEHFVSATCRGEYCGMCQREGSGRVPATHKVGEEIPYDSPQLRHNLTQYVCCRHLLLIMGPATQTYDSGCQSGLNRAYQDWLGTDPPIKQVA